MARSGGTSWTDAEIAQLLAAYFGDKLSEPQLQSLAANVSAAMADRAHRVFGREVAPANGVAEPTPTVGLIPPEGQEESKGVPPHADR